MGNPSVDAFKRYLDAHADRTAEIMQAALLEEGKKLATAINAAAPKGVTGRLEHSGKADFAAPEGSVTDFRSGSVISAAEAFGPARLTAVVVTAGGVDTTKAEKHGKVPFYDYALATEFGTTRERARPFFFPTFNANKAAIEQALATAFGESQLAWDAGYGPQVTSSQ